MKTRETQTSYLEIIDSLNEAVLEKVHFTILFLYYRVFMRNFLRLFVGVSFEKANRLRSEKQFILVGNHNSHIDTMAMMAAVPTSMLMKVHPIAAADYFGKHKVARILMKYVINAKLIHRKKDGGAFKKNPIEQMNDLLKAGESIIIFPEGTRGEPGVMQDFKKGVAILLKENPNVPYIPVYMDGFEKALPKGDGMLVPHNSTMRIGRAMRANSDDLTEILSQIHTDISTIKEEIIEGNKK